MAVAPTVSPPRQPAAGAPCAAAHGSARARAQGSVTGQEVGVERESPRALVSQHREMCSDRGREDSKMHLEELYLKMRVCSLSQIPEFRQS